MLEVEIKSVFAIYIEPNPQEEIAKNMGIIDSVMFYKFYFLPLVLIIPFVIKMITSKFITVLI